MFTYNNYEMDKFSKARNRFEELEGNKFGAVMHEMQDDRYLVEWRIRKADGAMCVIQYRTAKYYTIFQLTDNNVQS